MARDREDPQNVSKFSLVIKPRFPLSPSVPPVPLKQFRKRAKMLGNSYASTFSSLPSGLNKNPQSNYDSNGIGSTIHSRAAHYLDSIPEHSESNSSFPNSIGEYGMGRLLGRGAFGSVYEVTEIKRKTSLNDFKYAIKIVKTKKVNSH